MTQTSDQPLPRRWRAWALPLLLVLAGVLAYANSLGAAFVFDDHDHILDAEHIRSLWPPTRRAVISRRAVFNLSLAASYALDRALPAGWGADVSGLRPESYRAANVAIHVLAGLTLFGLARRALALPGLPPRLGSAAPALGFAIALLWLVHPLQTQAVTYLVQRSESLMGLFFLLALYALLRAAEPARQEPAPRQDAPPRGHLAVPLLLAAALLVSAGLLRLVWDAWQVAAHPELPPAQQRLLWPILLRLTGDADAAAAALPALTAVAWAIALAVWAVALTAFVRGARASRWLGLAVLAAGLGLLTKEVMVALPLVALLMDRALLAGSFAEALRRRWLLYAALVALLALLPIMGMRDVYQPAAQRTAGFAVESITPLNYALSQPGVILRYLQLSLWPRGLTLDYLLRVPSTSAALPPLAAVGALLAAAMLALWRWPRVGFLAASFFLVLAPSSSIMPINDLAMEHRMYLPLAVLAALAVLASWWALNALGRRLDWPQVTRRRAGMALLALAATALAAGTLVRNRAYRSEIAIWQDTVNKRSSNPRAHRNLAYALSGSGRVAEAAEHLQQSLTLHPRDPEGHRALGMMWLDLGRPDAAQAALHMALRLEPDSAASHYHLGRAWLAQDELERASAAFARAAELSPDTAEPYLGLGRLHERRGEPGQAWDAYRRAAELDPQAAEAYLRLGQIAFAHGAPAEAVALLRRAAELAPFSAEAHHALAEVLAATGALHEAIEPYRQAVELDPHDAKLRNRLGEALARRGDGAGAARQFEAALLIDPDNAEAHSNRGNLALERSEFARAIAAQRTAVRLAPQSAEFKRRLAVALGAAPSPQAADLSEALSLARRAARAPGGGSLAFLQTWVTAAEAVGAWEDAVEATQAALALAEAAGQRELAAAMRRDLDDYRRKAAAANAPSGTSE